jgi:hypothetical protein
MTDGHMAATIDHVVVNIRYGMDAAVPCLASIGFTLTPRGHHTLGSINHLMVLDDSYLELIGLPGGDGPIRKELLEQPLGINGLVFADEAGDARYQTLRRLGFRAEPPQSFSRPVECADGAHEARFTAVRLAGDTYPAGRVYFCHHHTPELVWRPEWQGHRNTAHSLAGLTVVGADPAEDARGYAACIEQDVDPDRTGYRIRLPAHRQPPDAPPADLRFMSEAAYRSHYGPLCCDSSGRVSYFGAISLRVRSLAAVRACVADGNPRLAIAELPGGGLGVSITALNCLLEFIEE